MIENQANDPSRTSWIPVPQNSDFPIQNLPFGVFIPEDDIITTGTRIGDTAIDLSALQQLGYFNGIDLPDDVFLQDTLNDFIALGRRLGAASETDWRSFSTKTTPRSKRMSRTKIRYCFL